MFRRQLVNDQHVLRREYLVALGLSLGPAASNGLARFAFALILPAMRNDLDWTYTQAGQVNTANALGYLAGAAATLALIDRVGARRLFNPGMVMTAVALIASGLVVDHLLLLVLRAVAGIGGAFVFISGGVLAAGIGDGDPRRAAQAIAVYFSGGGLGIALAGGALPWLFTIYGDGGWHAAWLVLGLLSAACCLGTWAAARAVPVRPRSDAPSALSSARWSLARFRWLAAGYLLFAFGYIGYMTFVMAWMAEAGAPATRMALVWVVLGVFTTCSHRFWRRPLAEWSGGRPMAATILVVAIGAALPLLGASLPLMLVSAVLFGGAFFITPAAATAFLRKSLPREAWGRAVAVFTLLFAAGQTAGPVVAGWFADLGGLQAGLAVSAVALLLGASFALMQRDVRAHHR